MPFAVLFALVGCTGGPDETQADPVEQRLRGMTLYEQAAQTIVAAMVSGTDTTAQRLRAEIATGAVGGILLRPPLDSVWDAARHSRSVAPWPLLTLVDRNGDAARLSELPPARLLAALASEETARSVGAEVGRRALASGGHLVLIGLSRLNRNEPLSALRTDHKRITRGIAAFAEGVREAGVLVGVAALEPGDTVSAPLHWDRARLQALELAELRSLLEQEVAAIELGAVSLPAIIGDSLRLPASPAAVEGLLRRDLGFRGVVMADLSPASPLVHEQGAGAAAVALLRAGTDLLLGVEEPAAVVDALVGAVREGRLEPGRVLEAARRVLQLRRAAGITDTLIAPDSTVHARAARSDPVGELQILGPATVTVAADAARAAARAGADERLAIDSTVAAASLEGAPPVVWPPARMLREIGPDSVGMAALLGERIDGIMEKALEDSVFTGAAVAVVRRAGLVMLRGYGRTGREGKGPPVDPHESLFDLASLTKVVGTTTAVALLVDDGRMELDTPVQRYLPEFVGDGKDQVLVRHLLTHTSGLPSGLWLFGSSRSADQALREVLKQELVREPGERVQYSDLGMMLLAEAVARVAEMPIDEFLALRVFAPLGMQHTMYLPASALRDDIVPTAELTERAFPLKGVVHDANSFRLGGIAGHAGLFSTARDLAVFGQMMLNGGSYATRRILDPATVEAFTTRQPGAEQRALGWDTPSRVSSTGDYFSARSFGHTGYTGTSLWIDPARDLLVVLLTNRTYTGATAREILDLRADVHDAAARAITDEPVRRRN